MKEIIDYINSKIKSNDTVIVACSGGPDSMCLLSLVEKANSNINIICAHVNHKVRVQSDEEEEYVKSYCHKHNIIYEGMHITEKIEDNFENEARSIRYIFFNKLMVLYGAKYILTAHHGDDLIETILMRITRGSTLSGYIGIKKEDNKYLRPLLDITKESILAYLHKENIKYYIDCTNDEDIHTRNRYRKTMLPFLKNENPLVHEKYRKFSEALNEYDIFVTNYIKDRFDIQKVIDIELLLKESLFIQKKVVELMIKKIQATDLLDVNDKNIDDVIKLINSNKSSGRIVLSNDYIAKKSYNNLSIEKYINIDNYEVKFTDYFENDHYIIKKVNYDDNKSNDVIRLDSNDLVLPLIARNKKDADKMYVKNLGNKKIKDIFIDSKIDLTIRETIPLIVDSVGKILWIPGIKKSKFDKEKNEKYDIILMLERKTDK